MTHSSPLYPGGFVPHQPAAHAAPGPQPPNQVQDGSFATTHSPSTVTGPASPSGSPSPKPEPTRSHLEKLLLGATVTAGIALGALGVTSSYQALLNKAAASPAAGGWGWGAHPWMLPIGLDFVRRVRDEIRAPGGEPHRRDRSAPRGPGPQPILTRPRTVI